MERGNLAELWPEHATCRLCGELRDLCRSHIVPKFVADWIRSTNVTGRLRTNEAPNRLVQDIGWRRLLCEACEGRFNKFETDVCETIFLPIHERRQDRFRYGSAFAKFIASVVWRALVVQREEGHLGKLIEIPDYVKAAELAWREFLLGKRRSPAPHDVHAIPLDVPVSGDFGDFSPHLARVLLRGVSQSTQCYKGAGYLVVKMARLFVVGTVWYGDERREWEATKIHATGGAWGVEEYAVPGWVFHLFKRHAQLLEDTMAKLSERQKQQTNETLMEAVRRDPEAFAASDNFKAFEHDLALFGPRAFQQPDDVPEK